MRRATPVATALAILFWAFLAPEAWAMSVSGPTPNPFNPSTQTTSLSFMFDTGQYASVYIVNQFHDQTVTYTNVYGGTDRATYHSETVKTLWSHVWVPAGTWQTVSWDGRSNNGQVVQRGTFYFKIVPESNPAYTRFVSIGTIQFNSDWLAYIRHARTWNGVQPYSSPGVSREPGYGSDCTGFALNVLREMGYSMPYPESDVYGMWASMPSYVTQSSWSNLKQSNLLFWKNSNGWNHVTIYTYRVANSDGSYTYYIIHSSSANNGVREEPIPSWYQTNFQYPPPVGYFNSIGAGGP